MTSIETVANKYRFLRFNGIAGSLEELVSIAEANDKTQLDFAELLADHELASRDKNRIALNLKRASFPVIKRLEEFDYKWQTTITKRQINAFLDFSFIENQKNVIFIGPPGVGKTHLASGIGLKAVEAGYRVFFTTAISMIESLELAELRGELKKMINSILKFDLLILDEVGYLPMDKSIVFSQVCP